jgi:phosphoribosylglycinamide formyltransferase-1
VLADYTPDLVAIAGFGTVMPKAAAAYPDRMLNTHPSLLPAFKGWHPVRDALSAGVKVTGCTVHIVDEKTDHGPIVIQAAVPVYSDDTVESLTERILAEEHRIYPEAVCLFAEGRIRIEGRRARIADEEPLADRALVSPALG